MKYIKTKTFWILLLFIGMIVFGNNILISLSDKTQKEICADGMCITKPKGWLPIFVDRDGDSFFLNIISMKKINQVIPYTKEDEDLLLSELSFDNNETKDSYHAQILLGKDSKSISIKRYAFRVNNKTEQYYRKFKYLSKRYYIKKDNYPGTTTIYYPEGKLYITMPFLDKNLLNEICSFK